MTYNSICWKNINYYHRTETFANILFYKGYTLLSSYENTLNKFSKHITRLVMFVFPEPIDTKWGMPVESLTEMYCLMDDFYQVFGAEWGKHPWREPGTGKTGLRNGLSEVRPRPGLLHGRKNSAKPEGRFMERGITDSTVELAAFCQELTCNSMAFWIRTSNLVARLESQNACRLDITRNNYVERHRHFGQYEFLYNGVICRCSVW